MGLTEEEKYNVCNIPYSQPNFLFCVLCIWTFTCFHELRTVYDLLFRLLINIKSGKTMEDATQSIEGSTNEMKIVSLTRPVKVFILVAMLLPRAALTLLLLWLGCRWI